MSRTSGPAAVASMALALGLVASPDLPPRERPRALGGIVAGLTIVFVVTLLDRRAPRRLVAVGVATLAAALGYDALRAENGSMTAAPGQGTASFQRREPGGAVSTRVLGTTLVLAAIEPDGTVVLARTGGEPLRVSARRAATVAGYRVGQPREAPGGGAVVPGQAVTLSVIREPAALLAGLGVLITAIGVVWSRW